MEKSTIALFGISAGILLLILNFVVLNPPIRHTRICEEARLLAAIGERQKLFSLSESLYDRALHEAESISSDDFRIAMTLDDLAFLHMRVKRFELADAELLESSRLFPVLLKKTVGLKRDLLISELIRVNLFQARCRVHFQQLEEARKLFLKTIRLQNEYGAELHSVDLAVLMRFKEAFCSYCKICVRTRQQADAVTNLVSALQPSGLPQHIPAYAKKEMRDALDELISAAEVPVSVQSGELEKILAQMKTDDSTNSTKNKKGQSE